MLAVAISFSHGNARESKFGVNLTKNFPNFEVMQITQNEALADCETTIYKKEKSQEAPDEVKPYFEAVNRVFCIEGPEAKIRNVVKQLLSSGDQQSQVIIQCNAGAFLFPGALQIFVVSTPASAWEPSSFACLKRANLVVFNMEGEEADIEDVKNEIKELNPTVQVFVEKAEQGMSPAIKHALTELFNSHLRKKQSVKDALLRFADKQVSCEEARKIAAEVKVSVAIVGQVCQEAGYKIKHCELGCF